jgi:hypothetical protein
MFLNYFINDDDVLWRRDDCSAEDLFYKRFFGDNKPVCFDKHKPHDADGDSIPVHHKLLW